MNRHTIIDLPNGSPGKFQHPDITAKGERRARVGLKALDTLWFNTGTLCNITCRNCYIESSPTNDRLAYLTVAEVAAFLDEIEALGLATREIGFTGGEPFMNPEFNAMLRLTLERGFEALVLTNAMQPMQRNGIRGELLDIQRDHGKRLTIRVSLDHHSRELHEEERGKGTFARALEGIDWLSANGFNITIAGRTCWGESENESRAGYRALFDSRGWQIDADHPASLVLFPEMDEKVDVPEITVDCWNILHKSPDDVMCASSRMVVKRKGDAAPTVLPCTLLPYDREFGMGTTLAEAARADGLMFDDGAVKLCHPHCAKFCVLGGASCSV
ncbi:MAG: radical SAM protein [Rhodobiaceae bacterium]|nr:radical SAM protein [Rhodobiaceae bacterium]MCC0054930.1 radical SAM protein [Rhodobiaceae bacterium]